MKNKILLILALLTLGTACSTTSNISEPTSKINIISNENNAISEFTNQ